MTSSSTPVSAIGARIPRRELKRLLSGHGRYVDDIKLPRMLHAAFVRSPHPHAKIIAIDTTMPASHRASPPFSPRSKSTRVANRLSVSRSTAPVIARRPCRCSRAIAPYGKVSRSRSSSQKRAPRPKTLQSLWPSNGKRFPSIGNQQEAIAAGAPAIHAELGDNIAFDFSLEQR